MWTERQVSAHLAVPQMTAWAVTAATGTILWLLELQCVIEATKVFNAMKVRKSTQEEIRKRKKAVLFCLKRWQMDNCRGSKAELGGWQYRGPLHIFCEVAASECLPLCFVWCTPAKQESWKDLVLCEGWTCWEPPCGGVTQRGHERGEPKLGLLKVHL